MFIIDHGDVSFCMYKLVTSGDLIFFHHVITNCFPVLFTYLGFQINQHR
jgi:hypothetical protein